MMKTWIACLVLLLLVPAQAGCWGFFGHQQINRLAVFTLPPEMIWFYKKHITYLTENAVNPDKRRYRVAAEAPRHYIDLDAYGDSAQHLLPATWAAAGQKFGVDSLQKHGVVPWHLNLVKFQLTEALRQHDVEAILRLSADLGHYVADACVPLHTTSNYNGQFTNQQGIHGLWESRLPELFASQYDFFTGPAAYLPHVQQKAWDMVWRANAAVDSVFRMERETAAEIPEDRKYAFEERGGITVKAYSRAFAAAYHQKLNGQVERQMRLAVALVGAFWYTCWVDAGQPDMRRLQPLTAEQQKALEEENQQRQPLLVPGQPHDDH
jgi:hypothetical protein